MSDLRHTANLQEAFYNQPLHARKYSRSPQQARSRESSERVLNVATVLLARKGYAGFSIVEVGRRAKVSIGSIYGRFSSKDDLIRSVQERVLHQVDQDEDLFLAGLEFQQLRLEVLLRLLVEHLADVLEAHATLLHAFIAQASQDPVIRARGRRSHDYAVSGFCRLLLQCRGEIRHADPERAVRACCSMMWRSFASYLGLETEEPPPRGDWSALVEDVYDMGLSYLIAPARAASPTPLRGKVRRIK